MTSNEFVTTGSQRVAGRCAAKNTCRIPAPTRSAPRRVPTPTPRPPPHNDRAPPPHPAVGGTRIVHAQALPADGEGVFAFTMVPGTPYPGERYDILMVTRRGGQTQESRFSLLQRPG